MFRLVDSATLRKLDLEGHEIESSLNYDLTRMDGFHPIEPRLPMRGLYHTMADAATFEECLTGRRFPVASEADNGALERARSWRITDERLELRDGDGALLARFEARPMP